MGPGADPKGEEIETFFILLTSFLIFIDFKPKTLTKMPLFDIFPHFKRGNVLYPFWIRPCMCFYLLEASRINPTISSKRESLGQGEGSQGKPNYEAIDPLF